MSYSIFPSQDEIANFKVKLTTGEEALLSYLKDLFSQADYLNRQFEIHVQCNLFLGKPDFIVIEPNYSMWIIEVKDYRSGAYKITHAGGKDSWQLANQNVSIPSPIQQVEAYKRSFFDYAGLAISTDKVDRSKYGLSIRTAVFFYNFQPEDAPALIRHTKLLFRNDFTGNQLNIKVKEFFNQTRETSLRLTLEECKEIKAIINPGENGENKPLPDFTGKYGLLCQSSESQKKIKGSAGTGKTSILAKRAVNASKRFPDEEILVTCFNITMCNYLQDKIVAEGGASINHLGIRVQHFHTLYNWKEISDKKYIIDGKKSSDQYAALFIDEGQDFEKEWFNRLKTDYLMKEKGEFVIFADENQNIYSRLTVTEEDEFKKINSLPATPILGPWTVINEVYRTPSNDILVLLNSFSNEKFQSENTTSQLSLLGDFDAQTVFYEDLTTLDNDRQLQAVVNQIDTYVHRFVKEGVSINDLAILSMDKGFLREVEYNLRTRESHSNLFCETVTTFKPRENKQDEFTNPGLTEDRPYKMRFYRNIGPIKFSTVHSFKGWETPYVILIISSSTKSELEYDRLVYTGLSRAKKKIVILNLNENYTDFFQKKLSDQISEEDEFSPFSVIKEVEENDDYDDINVLNREFWTTCPVCGESLRGGVCRSCKAFDWDSYNDNY